MPIKNNLQIWREHPEKKKKKKRNESHKHLFNYFILLLKYFIQKDLHNAKQEKEWETVLKSYVRDT